MFGPELGFGGPPLFLILFGTIVTLAVIGGFAYVIFKGVSTWMSNNASAVETKSAKLVGKRSRVSGGAGETSASTSYYLTFELENGERVELRVNGRDYGLLVEGDRGTLTYQGTRFHDFQRKTDTR